MTTARVAKKCTGPAKDGAVVQLEIGASDEKVRAYMMAVVDLLGSGVEKVKDALQRISTRCGNDEAALRFQLLAVRRYCRKVAEPGVDLAAIWGWTEAEVTVNKKLEPTKTLYAEAAKVQAAFKQNNPGCSLNITPVRSVERQVALWVQNATVKESGEKLLAWARMYLASSDDEPNDDSAGQFQSELLAKKLAKEPTNAAPGLSDHGRGLAVDFVALENGKVVAGIKTSMVKTDWIAGGWLKKLEAACEGTRLRGPLPKPYEPWHWWLGA